MNKNIGLLLCFLLILIGCSQKRMISKQELSTSFKRYWFSGLAEVTSYELTQNRYGELRKGKAVTIYVTEDFDTKKQVKTKQSKNKEPVLKLNLLKEFQTGIYPYKIMQSNFSTLQYKHNQIVKASYSQQEWCGQIYMQLNSTPFFSKSLKIKKHSYFEENNEQKLQIDAKLTEQHLWNQIRINGSKNLPLGKYQILPSFEFLALYHKSIKTYSAVAQLHSSLKDKTKTYLLSYPNLKRDLKITFEDYFPYKIISWEEYFKQELICSAKRIKVLRTDYWNKNSNQDTLYINELHL